MEYRLPYITRERYSESEGLNKSWRFSLEPGIGKDNTTYPYVMVNEWVAANVAQFLQLPLAPFGLFKRKDRTTLMFGSVNFEGDSKPKRSRPDECWREHADLCTGIVLFDALIANNDRYDGNLKVDNSYKPKVVYLFDHDQALLGKTKGEGIHRLRSLDDRLGISGGDASGGAPHCFLDVIDSGEHFPKWLDLIYDIPRSFVQNVCDKASGLGASKPELDEIVRFLSARAKGLARIIDNHKSAFKYVHEWPGLL